MSGQHNLQTLLQQLTLPGFLPRQIKLVTNALDTAKCITGLKKVDFLVGKIKGGFDQHTELREFVLKLFDVPGKLSLQGTNGRAGRGGSACVDEVGNGFSLGEVHFAIQESALAEFAGFRQPCAEIQAAG